MTPVWLLSEGMQVYYWGVVRLMQEPGEETEMYDCWKTRHSHVVILVYYGLSLVMPPLDYVHEMMILDWDWRLELVS